MKYYLLILFVAFNIGSLYAQEYGISYPKHNQVVSDTNVTINWNEYVSASSYQLQIATDSLFQNIILDSSQIMPSGLNVNLSYGAYFIRIKPLPLSPSPSLPFSSSSKFTIFSPKTIDSLVLWLAADTGVTKNAIKKVSQWNDLSGYNNNAQQSSSSLQPIIVDSIIGRKPTISFIGGDYLLSGQYVDTVSNRNRTVFTLIDNHYLSGYNIPFSNFILNHTSFRYFEPFYYSNKVQLILGNGIASESKNLVGDISNIKVICLRINNSHVSLYSNTVLASQANYSVYSNAISRYAIGGRSTNGSNIYHPFNGKVFEIIDYVKPLDSAQIQLVNKYLLDKYTPPVNLGQNILRRYGFCDTTLSTKELYESYLWSTGDTTRSISITKEDTGWYWCEVPNLYGDIMRDSLYVFDLVGQPNLLDTTVCFGDSSSLQSAVGRGQSGYIYEWKDSQNQTVSTDSVLQMSLQDTYSLKISDTLGCFITDTVQVLVDSFEVQASLGPDKSLCTGDKIGLTTAQAQADSFLWNAGSTDSLLQINTAGTYSLIVKDTIGCIAKDTINVSIHGITPYVAFSADTVCFRDSTLFIDSSYSMDQSNLINWKWELGDGSQPINLPTYQPFNHLYPDSGTYTAKLTVSTDSNCANYAYRNVYVRPLPEPDFYPLTGCQNLEITFDNLTSTAKDSAVGFIWDFGDGTQPINLPTYQPVNHIYGNSGQFNTVLTATDIHGCSDSISQSVDIKPSPLVNFSYSSVCDGTPVSFADQSQTLPYNPIMTYEWTFIPSSLPPFVSTSPSPKFTFPNAGYHYTKLLVTSLNACWDTITLPVKVNAIPQAGFTLSNACSGSATQFIDTSIIHLDTINSWYWVFNPFSISPPPQVSTSPSPQVTFNDTLIHHATLRVKSKAGCQDSISKTFKIYPSPTAAFTLDPEYGLPPLTVNFTNLSTYQPTNPLTYNWTFGDGIFSVLENPSHTYIDSNTFNPKLIVENTYGCKDSISHTVYAVYARVDIAIIELASSIDGGYARFSCVIENHGQQKIKRMDLTANYNGGQSIQEQWSGELLPGQKTTYVFQAKVKVQGIPAYYCVTATPQNTDIEDESPVNNTLCKEYQAQLWVGNIYPNPATDFINIDVILPYNQEVQLLLSNSLGKELQSTTIKGQRGLNQLKINTSSLSAGVYYMHIRSGEEDVVRTVIIR